MKKRLLLLAILSVSSFLSNAQVDWIEKSDEELAIQFYQDGEYQKAVALFEDLMDDGKNERLYDYYLNCLLKLEEYNDAEKFLKKALKTAKQKGPVTVDLAYVYKLQGDERKQKKTYDELFENLGSNVVEVQAVASAFERREQLSYAIRTFNIGRRKSGNDLLFAKPLAELYGKQNELENMVLEYLNYLLLTPSADEEVKGALAEYIDEEQRYETIKTTLLKKVQSNPDVPMYTDLLSWLLVSKQQFLAAFMQLKGLDKRLGEQGKRVFKLASVCVQNKEYKVAEQCYEYVTELQPRSPYFYQARLGAINMKYARITETANYSQEDLIEIEADYKRFVSLNDIPFGEKWNGYLRLTEIQALYLDKVDEATATLSSLVRSPRLPDLVKGRMKLALADYLLMQGRIWDAKLKYWQVEKDFKDHPLGSQAKFMKAKISFYTGEFELAKSLLDVLKGSTSELIANDALQLGMIIQDNYGLDTVAEPLELYAKADKYLFMNKLDSANQTLDSILTFFPKHSLEDEIYYAKAKIFDQQRNYAKSLEYLEKVYTAFNFDLLADDALFLAADIYEYKLKNDTLAFKVLEKLVLEHTGSIYSVEASERYRKLRAILPKEAVEPTTP